MPAVEVCCLHESAQGEPKLAGPRAANWQLKRESLPEEAGRPDAAPNRQGSTAP